MEKNHRQSGSSPAWQQRGLMQLISKKGRSDVLGSYTGVPLDDEEDQPVQDADDL